MPELQTFFSSGSLVDGVLKWERLPQSMCVLRGMTSRPIRIWRSRIASRIRRLAGIADVYVPHDIDYPSLRIAFNRTRAGELRLTEKEVVSNIITALTSSQVIAPSLWIDPNSGNNYFLTVMYKDGQIKSIDDLKAIPLHRTDVRIEENFTLAAAKSMNKPDCGLLS